MAQETQINANSDVSLKDCNCYCKSKGDFIKLVNQICIQSGNLQLVEIENGPNSYFVIRELK